MVSVYILLAEIIVEGIVTVIYILEDFKRKAPQRSHICSHRMGAVEGFSFPRVLLPWRPAIFWHERTFWGPHLYWATKAWIYLVKSFEIMLNLMIVLT